MTVGYVFCGDIYHPPLCCLNGPLLSHCTCAKVKNSNNWPSFIYFSFLLYLTPDFKVINVDGGFNVMDLRSMSQCEIGLDVWSEYISLSAYCQMGWRLLLFLRRLSWGKWVGMHFTIPMSRGCPGWDVMTCGTQWKDSTTKQNIIVLFILFEVYWFS